MKYVKMLGLLALAAAALMAFAGSASATKLTSPHGTPYTGPIHAHAGETTLHGAATITCLESTVEAEVEQHGDAVTVEGPITHLTFLNCAPNDVTVLKPGRLIVHTDENDPNGTSGNGTLTSVGAEVTIRVTGLGINCIYGTPNPTHIGTVTGSTETGGNAILHIDATIERTGHSIFCGSTGTWTGTYEVTTPKELSID